MRFVLFIIIFVLCVGLVSAGFSVVPSHQNLTIFVGQESVFGLTLNNSNNFSIRNVSFTNIPDFTFPFIGEMSAHEVRSVQFSVDSLNLYELNRASVLSFLYGLNVNQPSKTFVIRITDSGFVPSSVIIRNIDFVLWKNELSSQADIRDLVSL